MLKKQVTRIIKTGIKIIRQKPFHPRDKLKRASKKLKEKIINEINNDDDIITTSQGPAHLKDRLKITSRKLKQSILREIKTLTAAVSEIITINHSNDLTIKVIKPIHPRDRLRWKLKKRKNAKEN